MSPQGCLSAFFLGLLLAWSLVVGAFMTAGWLGAEVIEFVSSLFFADLAGARRASEDIIQFLRAIGFGVFASIWALGAGVIVLFWFASLRGARQTEEARRHARIDIDVVTFPPDHEMKDVTPGRADRDRPPEILPPR